MIEIYCSEDNYTFDDNVDKIYKGVSILNYNYYYEKGIITDKYYKPVFKKGDITIRPKEEVLEQVNKHIPPNLPFDNNTYIAGGFMLKLVCKQFNIEDYPNTDIDIFTYDNTNLVKFFEEIGYEEKVKKGQNIVEYKLKDYKYKFQIIHMCIYNIEDFDFGHNEVFYNGISKQILGSKKFIVFIKYQISICNFNIYGDISPKRIIKALNYNLRLYYNYCKFDFYPDIFQIIDVKIDDSTYIHWLKDYIINPEKLIFEEHIDTNGKIKGNVDIILDKKYENTEYHFNLLKYIKNNCFEASFSPYIIEFSK